MRLEDWLQECSCHLLGHPVTHDGNAQRAGLRASRLGDVDTAQRFCLERPAFQVAHERPQIGFEVRVEHLHADFVNTSRPTISFDVFEGLAHCLGRDSPRQ